MNRSVLQGKGDCLDRELIVFSLLSDILKSYRSIFLYAFCFPLLALILTVSSFPVTVFGSEPQSITITELAKSYLGSINDNETPLDLYELIHLALTNNRDIEIARQQTTQEQGRYIQARSGYLPQVGVNGYYNYLERRDSAAKSNTNGASGQSSTAVNEEVEEDDVLHGSVSFSQLIYDFGRTTGNIRAKQSMLEASDVNLLKRIQYVVFQVKSMYFNVLEKRRLIDNAYESVKIFTHHLEQAGVYLRAGMRTKIDVINAEIELSNARMRLLRAKYKLKAARVDLEQVIGVRPFGGNYILRDDEVNLATILDTMPPVPSDIDNLVQLAFKQRPDLLYYQILLEAAEADIDKVKGAYWPTLSAEASYNEYDTELSLFKDSWDVGITWNWNLFSGLHTEGALAESKGKKRETRARLQNQQLIVIKEVTESYLNADENLQSVHLALQILDLAKENFQLAQKRYKTGTFNVTEFNDAQFNLTEARNELVVTYHGYLRALAAIEFSTGSYTRDPPKTVN